MTAQPDEPTMTAQRKRRPWRKAFVIATGVLLVFALAGACYTTTDRFHAWLRAYVITALQDATGGRVELGAFRTIPFRLRMEGRDLTLHGTEKAGDMPLGHADKVVAELRLTSLLTGQLAFRHLLLERPRVRIEFAADGTSNLPSPKGPVDPRTAPEQLFGLSIAHLEVHNGELIWNDQAIPVDFSASGISGGMAHTLFRRRYEGKAHADKVDTALQDLRPFAWSGDLEFGLTRNRLDIKSLSATSGRSQLHFTGDILGFVHPQISGRYEIHLDIADTGSVVRTNELAGGFADIKGEGKWTEKSFSAAGTLSVRDGLWKMKNSAIRVASGSTQFELTDRLEFRGLQARALGGEVTGDAKVNHWLASLRNKSNAGKREDSVGEVHLKVRDLAAGDLLALLNSPDVPLDRLHAVGSASGAVESHWTKRIETADTEVDLQITPPAQVAGGTLALAGNVHGTYHGALDQVDLAQLDLGTQGTRLQASGILGANVSNLHVTANSANLSEWESLLRGFRGTAQVPLSLSGRGSFSGWLSGSLRQPTLEGKVELDEFKVSPRGVSDSVLDHMRWDRMTADLQASPEAISAKHGVLEQGTARVNFEGEAGLARAAFTPESPISATLSLQDADVQELQSLFGYSYPVTGRLSFSGQVGGNKSAPHGEGNLRLQNATVYGESVPSASAKLKWAGADITLEDIDAKYASGQIRGIAGYNLDAGTFHSQISGDGFDLALLPRLRDSQIPATGSLKFTATGTGTLAEPVLDATADLESLAVGEETQGGFHFEAKTQGANMHFGGRSVFQEQRLAFDGDIQLRGDWPVQAKAQFDNLDLDPILQRYLHGRVTGHSTFSGTLDLSGPLRRPVELNATGVLTKLSAGLQNVAVTNDGPVRFQVKDHVLHLEETHLAGDNTKLLAGGTIELAGRREIDFHASGQLNLGLLQTMYPDFLTTGTVDIQGRATGTLSEPVLQGKVTVVGGGVAVPGQPASLSDINGTLVFTQDRLQIEQLTAHSGGGLIRLGGYMQYGRYLEFSVTAQGEDVRLRYPPGMSSTANADLRFYGTSNGAVLSGELQVTRFSLSQGFDFGSYLSSSRQSNVLAGSDSLLNKIRFDLHIYTAPDLRFDSSLARVSGDADLRLRGTMAKPVLLGRTNIQEGQIFFNGAKYELERGDISFTNPVKINPVVDLTATIRVRDYDIEVGFHGTSDKLNVVYRSEPPLPQADIIALLALGRTQEESARLGASQSAFTQEASSAILGQAINATVSSRVQKLFGVSRIKIDPQAPGTETSTYQGPQVTIEQQVSNKLTLTYVQPVSQATQQTIQGEYNVTRNISVVAVRDQNGVFALDIRIRQRKR